MIKHLAVSSFSVVIILLMFIAVIPNQFSSEESIHIYGLGYSGFRDGQDPGLNVFPTKDDMEEDVRYISKITDRIRTYGSSGYLEPLAEIASKFSLKITLGVWISDNASLNEEEISRAINASKAYTLESIVVGNEVLVKGDVSEQQLIQYIRDMKENTSVPVTTAEPWWIWKDHPNLASEVDYIMVHIYPYWDGIDVENAADYVLQKYQELQDTYPDKEIVVGETGWPSDGDKIGEAVANGENQARFLKEFIEVANKNIIKYYIFEVFDEKWKSFEGSYINENNNLAAKNWGIIYSDGTVKEHINELLNLPSMVRE